MRRTPNFGWRVVIVAAALRNRGCSLLRGPFECLEESLTRPCNFSQKATGRCFQQFSAPFLGVKCVHNCYQCVLEGQGRGATGRIARTHTYWEALGCALCLLTAREIPRTGPVWGWGVCPGSRRPRARVPLVVRAWDLVCCPASLLWSPGPRPSPVFRSAICDCLSLNVIISFSSRFSSWARRWLSSGGALGPSGAGGGGLGGWWVVCGAGRRRVRRLPAVAFSRSGLCSVPSWFFACLFGLARFLVPGLCEMLQYIPR